MTIISFCFFGGKFKYSIHTFAIDFLLVVVVQVVLFDLLLVVEVLIVVVAVTVLLLLGLLDVLRLLLEGRKLNGKRLG